MANYKVSIQLDAEGNAVAKFQELNSELKQTKETAGQGGLLGQLGPLGTAVAAVGGAFAAWQIGEKALQLRNMGQEATQTANTFYALQGGAQAAEMTMSRLRTVTRGIVDDTTLMAGASQLMGLNVAKNNDELAQFVEMAVALKKPTDSAAEAIDNFSALMANQSVLRLDSFKISSAAVREEIEQLLASGQALNREDAFRMAVLDQGAAAMDRLGSSIDANASQWDRLMTRIENAKSALGEGLFNVGEGIAGGLNAVVGALEGPVARMEDLANRVTALETGQAGGEGGGGQGPSAPNIPGMSQLTEDQVLAINSELAKGGLQNVMSNPQDIAAYLVQEILGQEFDTANLQHQAVQSLVEGFSSAAAAAAPDLVDEITDVYDFAAQAWQDAGRGTVSNIQELQAAITWANGLRDKYQFATDELATAQTWLTDRNAAVIAAISERAVSGTADYGAWSQPLGPGVHGAADPGMLAASQRQQFANQAERRRQRAREVASLWSLYNLNQSYDSMELMGEFANIDLVGPRARQMQEAQRQQAVASNYSARAYRAVAANRDAEQRQQFAGWFTGGVRDLWGGVTEAGTRVERVFDRISAAVETARARFDTLSEVLGQGQTTGFNAEVYGGIAGQITDPEARAAFERAVGLTTTGQAAFSDVTALIAGMSGGEQTQAAQTLAAYMQSGRFSQYTTQADIMQALGYFNVPGAGGGQRVTVGAGMTVSGLAAQYGVSQADIMQAAGITNPRLLQAGAAFNLGGGGGWQRTVGASGPEEQGDTGFTQAGDPFQQMADQARTVSDEVDNIRSGIEGIDGMTAAIRFVMSADLPPILHEILAYTSVGQMLAQTTQNNGGVPPGTNNRSAPTSRARNVR